MQTSTDILHLSIAAAILLIALFFCWMMFYIIMMLKDARDMVADVRQKMAAIDGAIQSIRSKVESGLSSFGVVAAALKQVMSFMMEKRAERKEEREWREESGGPSKRKK